MGAAANGSMQFHDAANIFPLDDDNIATLADDIRANKQQVAIELLDGKVIDGRRRWLACKMAGKVPVTKDVEVDDPVSYVLSLNLHRRHLSPSQLSMVGARARELYDAQAKARQKAGGKAGREKQLGGDVENLPPPQKARDAVGVAIGVSGKTIDHATKVLERAIPEVVKAVDEGKMAVSTAAILAAESPATQREEINEHLRRMGNKTYAPKGPKPKREEDNHSDRPEGERRGVGILRANEAINCLSRIPKNDALRKRGFQVVTDWIRKNR